MSWQERGSDRIQFTPVGELAYRGRRADLEEALGRGVDWTREQGDPVEGAIRGRHFELIPMLLAAGAPLPDGLYALAADTPGALEALPPRPDLVERFRRRARARALAEAILWQEPAQVRALLADGAPLDDSADGVLPGDLPPLHLAVRRGHLEIVRVLLDAGAQVDRLDHRQRSPLRRAAGHRFLSGSERRGMVSELRSRGASLVPPPTVAERILVALGLAIDPVDD